jgi:hypothetical protein
LGLDSTGTDDGAVDASLDSSSLGCAATLVFFTFDDFAFGFVAAFRFSGTTGSSSMVSVFFVCFAARDRDCRVEAGGDSTSSEFFLAERGAMMVDV